ncbi:hypothetical protein TNCV_2625651 [Trichonephila clavipes]|nr:hypothetical protein TNCV_2625651 [Trichonephila clavipes]
MEQSLFCDESKLSRQSDYHRVFTWRENGARFHLSCVTKIDRLFGKGILFCGGIMLGSRTPQYVFHEGTVNSQYYRDDNPDVYVRSGYSSYGLRLEVSRSQPIEYVWDGLEKAISQRSSTLRTPPRD